MGDAALEFHRQLHAVRRAGPGVFLGAGIGRVEIGGLAVDDQVNGVDVAASVRGFTV